MKHIKLILIIAVMAVVSAFIIWHLMWMNDIAKKFKTEQLSEIPDLKEAKENKKGRKDKTETAGSVAGKDRGSVKEGQAQKSQAERLQQKVEKPGIGKAAPGADLPQEAAVPEPIKGPSPRTGENVASEKKGPAIKGTGQITQKNILSQPAERPDIKAQGIPQYPTSTAPK